jgi:hypothetical protein
VVVLFGLVNSILNEKKFTVSKNENNCDLRGVECTPSQVRKVGCANLDAASLDRISTSQQCRALVRLVGLLAFLVVFFMFS